VVKLSIAVVKAAMVASRQSMALNAGANILQIQCAVGLSWYFVWVFFLESGRVSWLVCVESSGDREVVRLAVGIIGCDGFVTLSLVPAGGRADAGKAATLHRLTRRALGLICSDGGMGVKGTALVVGFGFGNSWHVIIVVVILASFLWFVIKLLSLLAGVGQMQAKLIFCLGWLEGYWG